MPLTIGINGCLPLFLVKVDTVPPCYQSGTVYYKSQENFSSMDFKIDELTSHVAQTAREFAQKNIMPHVMEWDESQHFPVQTFKEMGKLGLMGVLVPEEYGGAGLSYFEYKSVIEEIAKVCGSIGLSVAAHNSLCTGHIMLFANEEQKKKYLPKLATAEWIGAWGLTEPGTGSDAGNMKCTAVKDGND